MRIRAFFTLALCATAASCISNRPIIGKQAALALEYPEIDFDPPEATLHTLPGGVRVLHLEDRSLPLVTVQALFRGGYVRFPREYYAAASALPLLLQGGGTRTLPPDSLEALLDLHSVQTSFGSGGGAVTSSVNSLARDAAFAIALWGQTLKEPRFDPQRVEVWRGQELDYVSRRKDDPARLAIGTFNHLMYGDHPIGWEMSEADLQPDAVSLERLTWVQHRVLCPGNMILGVTGDISWEEAEPLLLQLVEGWTPCEAPLPPAPLPQIRAGGGVFLLPRPLEQSTIALAHLTTLKQGDDPEYFASVIGNSILGGSGFSSRLVSRVRTERGYAYSVSSLWNTPLRGDGLIGAIGQTKSTSTSAALRLILDTFREMTETAPSEREVRTAIDQAVNGFVFNFESADQIVFRQMLYLGEGQPTDWLERYVAGLQRVTPEDVLQVFRRYAHPEQMAILVVGNPSAFDAPLSTIGPVTELPPP